MDVKEKSLINLAEDHLKQNKEPINLYELFNTVVDQKGLELADPSKTLNDFYAELAASAKFVYTGENTWDLKSNQPIEQWDKDGSDFKEFKEIHDEEMDRRIEAEKEREKAHQAMLEERREREEAAKLREEEERALENAETQQDLSEDDDPFAEDFEDLGSLEDDIVPEDEFEEEVDILEQTNEDEDEEEKEEDEKYLEYLDDYEDEYDK